MTTYNKATLKTFFENGDVPSGQNYADFIDSQVNLVETAEQTMGGALKTTELIAPRVSATNVNVTGILSANTLSLDSISASAATLSGQLRVGTTISAASLNLTGNASVDSLTVTNDVSAPTATIYASAMRSTNGLLCPPGIVSAAGTAQATAAILINVVNRGKGVVDGQTTGFMPLANRAGLVQYLYNEGASANLWPPIGGTINGLAANAAFSLATSAMVTIVHLTASAMAVK